MSWVEDEFGMVPEYHTKRHTPRGTEVEVNVWKVGGGTVGKAYDNELWAFVIRSVETGNVIFEGNDLKVPGDTMHKDIPKEALAWLG